MVVAVGLSCLLIAVVSLLGREVMNLQGAAVAHARVPESDLAVIAALQKYPFKVYGVHMLPGRATDGNRIRYYIDTNEGIKVTLLHEGKNGEWVAVLEEDVMHSLSPRSSSSSSSKTSEIAKQ